MGPERRADHPALCIVLLTLFESTFFAFLRGVDPNCDPRLGDFQAMNAEGEPPREWPSRGPELIRTASIMATLATLVAGWRLVVRFRVSWSGISDWLMLGGVVCCN